MHRAITALAFCIVLAFVPLARAENWPAWRGADGTGKSSEKGLPLKWSNTENVAWKVELPARGNATPVIWGERIFVAQASEKGDRRGLMCFSKADGKLLWHKWIEYAEKEPTHETNPFCSASPATDGKHVVVSLGSAGLVCYDFEGKQLWHRDFGKAHHIWGNAASPVLHGDRVILNFGPGERTFLIAVDLATGKDVWQADEPGGKYGEKGGEEWIGSWTTPVVIRAADRDELIMSWPDNVKAYDPQSGKVLWTCRGLERDKPGPKLMYTSPVVSPQLVVAMGGFGGPYLAVKPGGDGDVTETHRPWRGPGGPQRIGSGVIVGEHLYIVNEPGTAQCFEIAAGKSLWTERIGGGVWGSLVLVENKLYVTNLDGETIVMAARPKFEVLARNPLGERTLSSIAVSDGAFYLRTYKHLWRIEEPKK